MGTGVLGGAKTSVASRLKSRIEPLEFDPNGIGSELQINFGFELIAMGLPGGHLLRHGVDVGDASVQALAHYYIDLDLDHGEPAAVLGRVDELERIPQHLGLIGCEGRVERRPRPPGWCCEVVLKPGD